MIPRLIAVPRSSKVQFSRIVTAGRPGSPRTDALRLAPTNISSTGVAKAMGIHPYTSRQRFYDEKKGAPPKPIDDFAAEAMRLGVEEEPVCRRLCARVVGALGLPGVFMGEAGVFRAPNPHHFFTATPDSFIFLPNHTQILAEFKRTGSLPAQPRTQHALQVLVQCVATGADAALLFYTSPSFGWKLFAFDLSVALPYFQSDVVPMCRDFLHYVNIGVRPGPCRDRRERQRRCDAMIERAFTLVAQYDGPVYRACRCTDAAGEDYGERGVHYHFAKGVEQASVAHCRFSPLLPVAPPPTL